VPTPTPASRATSWIVGTARDPATVHDGAAHPTATERTPVVTAARTPPP